jgi:mRNA interferase HigB
LTYNIEGVILSQSIGQKIFAKKINNEISFSMRNLILIFAPKYMKVHLIKKQSIEDFVLRNAKSRASFEVWLSIIKRVDWNEPSEIVATFNSADILGRGTNRVVFNIGGNNFRLICKYHFGNESVHLFVKWIGTHAAYTKLCSEGKQYKINLY